MKAIFLGIALAWRLRKQDAAVDKRKVSGVK